MIVYPVSRRSRRVLPGYRLAGPCASAGTASTAHRCLIGTPLLWAMRVGLDRCTRLLGNLSMFDHHFALVIGHGQAQRARRFIEIVNEADNRGCGAIHFRQERPNVPMAELLLEPIMKSPAQLRHSTVFNLKRSQVDARPSLESVKLSVSGYAKVIELLFP